MKPTTRHAPTGADPDASNERHMSNPLIQGIGIGTNYVARAARARPPRQRAAMFWLTRYARTLDLTQDQAAGELGLTRAEVREALTDPECEMSAFTAAVERLKAAFEHGLNATHPESNPFSPRLPWHEAFGAPANTLVYRKVKSAVRLAKERPALIEVVGLERLGKTICLRHHFLRTMDRAAWIDAPVGRTENDWLLVIAGGLGIGTGTALKNNQLRPKIEACLGPGRIEVLFIDEAHRLLPRDLRQRPDRLEDLRSYLDRFGVSTILGCTPQFADMVGTMVQLADEGLSFWRAGQHIGRRQPFDLPETLHDDDLAAIAGWHAPGFGDGMIRALVEWAKADPGYIGTMVKIIERAAHSADGARVTMELLGEAKDFVAREARRAALAEEKKILRLNPARTRHLKGAQFPLLK